MARIGILIGNLFEDSEYGMPAEAFRNAGYELEHLGFKADDIVTGIKKGTQVHVDRAAKDATVDDFDALLIPGGYSPDQLRADDDVVRFTREFALSGKPVFAICHGPQLLISAQVLEGRRMTGWRSIVQDIKNAGAEFVDAEVVEDGNFISSRHPGDLPGFIAACLKRLAGVRAA
jgi:protease I